MLHFDWIFTLLVTFLWGIMPILGKTILKTIHPTTFVMTNSFIAFLFSAICGLYYYKTTHSDLTKILAIEMNVPYTKNILLLTLIFGATIFTTSYLYNTILSKNEPHIIAVLTACYPLITFSIAYFWLNEKMTGLRVLAFALVMAGIICFALDP